MNYIGIDPGKEGGWGYIDSEGRGIDAGDLPYLGKELDIGTLHQCLMKLPKAPPYDVTAVIEHPMALNNQSDTGILHSGMNFGALVAICTLLGFRVTTPRPSNWKASMGLSSSKGESVRQAVHMHPNLRHVLVGPRGGGRDGVAEALLIAEYQRRLDGKRNGRPVAEREPAAPAKTSTLLERLRAGDA